MDPQLEAAIVGASIGIAGSLITTAFATKLSAVKKRAKIATLLLAEVKSNEDYLSNTRDFVSSIDAEGTLDLTEFGDRRGLDLSPPLPEQVDFYEEEFFGGIFSLIDLQPNTDVRTQTLQDQGLLHETTLEALQTFYTALENVGQSWRAARKVEGRVQMGGLLENVKTNANRALEIIEPTEASETGLKAKLKAEKKWLNPLKWQRRRVAVHLDSLSSNAEQ